MEEHNNITKILKLWDLNYKKENWPLNYISGMTTLFLINLEMIRILNLNIHFKNKV